MTQPQAQPPKQPQQEIPAEEQLRQAAEPASPTQRDQRSLSPIAQIQLHFTKENVMSKIASHCNTDVNGVERVVRGIVNAIRRSQDDKLALCTPQSFVNCIYDAHALGLAIDKRELCYLVRYGTEATVQPGYKGYLFRLEKNLDGFFHKEFIWWEEGEFTHWDENGQAKYIYKPKKAARSDYEKAIGVAVYISYYIHGEKVSLIETIDKAEIAKIRKMAKSDKVWNQWLGEKMQISAIRRICKERFSSLTSDLDEKDNEHNDFIPMDEAEKPKSAARRFEEKMASEKYNPFPGETGPTVQDASYTEVKEGAGDAQAAKQQPDEPPPAAEPAGEERSESPPPPAAEPEPPARPDIYDGVPEWDGTLNVMTADGVIEAKKFININAAYGALVTQMTKMATQQERDELFLLNNPTLAASLYRHQPKIYDSLIELIAQGGKDEERPPQTNT